jgi:hypothetical protein
MFCFSAFTLHKETQGRSVYAMLGFVLGMRSGFEVSVGAIHDAARSMRTSIL